MSNRTTAATQWNRRDFVKGVASLAGVGWLSSYMRFAAAEPPPETSRIRLLAVPAICLAPQYVAEALLKAEGFTDVQYTKFDITGGNNERIARAFDISSYAVGNLITSLDVGMPVVGLAGVHLGCYELFGTQRVRAIRDLKGKSVSVDGIGGPQHVFLSTMLAYVGLDPRKDVKWVVGMSAEAMQSFVDGKAEAFLGFPPEPQELRAKRVGHVVINTTIDKPWSQYYCCMLVGNNEFVKQYPVATKRAVRAVLKAADFCAREPERAAQMIVAGGFTERYDYAVETLKQVPYTAWRTYNPDDTVRFHALRLHEVGMIKSDPNKLIAQGTDWRFLNELKRELKA